MWLIGIDDTDIPETRGTGRLARMLVEELGACGLMCRGVTRHQLLVHPSVPYTSHNSAACIGLEEPLRDADELFAYACEFVLARSPEGSDPGVCVAEPDRVSQEIQAFGRKSQQQVVQRVEAEGIAAASGCRLAGLAGSRQGVIGALAAVGLRAGGNDGRFIELGRVRDLDDQVRVRDLMAAGVQAVLSEDGDAPGPDARVETYGWARPRLVHGQAVLVVQRGDEDGTEWVAVDRSNSRRSGRSASAHTGQSLRS